MRAIWLSDLDYQAWASLLTWIDFNLSMDYSALDQ